MKQTKTICDFCKDGDNIMNHRMSFIRHFDDTDGRTFYDHILNQYVDVCECCLDRIIKSGKFPIDNRVQGYGDIIINDSTEEATNDNTEGK